VHTEASAPRALFEEPTASPSPFTSPTTAPLSPRSLLPVAAPLTPIATAEQARYLLGASIVPLAW
jgi:hypothetical protein